MRSLFRNWRFWVVLCFFVVVFGVLIFRAYQLQLDPENRVAAVAEGQFGRRLRVVPRRASLLDRNGRTLAMSVNAPSVFIDPRIIESPHAAAGQLSRVLGMPSQRIEALIRSNRTKRFVWLKRQISSREEREIQALDLRGVGLAPEFKRQYVLGSTASTLLGHLSADGRGLSGIEASYNEELVGEESILEVKRDAKGRPLFDKVAKSASGRSGWKSLYLTVDTDLQYLVEKHLSEALLAHKAKAGVAIVMNPHNGEILALADLPNVDPAHEGVGSARRQRSRVVSDPIEPGSVLKIFLVGEALDRGVVNMNSILQTPEKTVKISGKTIGESESRHERSAWPLRDAVKFSSNVAMVKLLEKVGPAGLREVYERVGFGQKTGIDLPGESRGIFNKWKDSKKLEWATMSFGQGIALTPMQIAAAYSMLANGGRRVRPRLLKEIHEGSRVIEKSKIGWEPSRSLWSPETHEQIKELLAGVVQADGSGRNAIVPNHVAAGKTGTSQKVDFINGGYKAGAYWSSFVGFAPLDDPQVVVYVMLDEPQDKFYYGGVVAAPVFSKIVQSALRVPAVRRQVH